MGIPLLLGREFSEADVHPDSASNLSTTVAVINRTMAHRFFANSSPLGKHFHFVEGNRPPLEIVGVIRSIARSPSPASTPFANKLTNRCMLTG